MSTTPVKCISDIVEDLADGGQLPPGEIAEVDLDDPFYDRLLKENRIVALEPVQEPTKKELQERAAELDITGRSNMSIDELRRAIAEKEKEVGV
jgi:hypothetical protein